MSLNDQKKKNQTTQPARGIAQKAANLMSSATRTPVTPKAGIVKPGISQSSSLTTRRTTGSQALANWRKKNRARNAQGVQSTQYNFQTKPQNEWTAADMAAYGRQTGDQRVFEMLNQSSDTRGTQFWNLYRGGRSVLPDGCAEFFKNNFGYEGPFDQKFCDEWNAIYGNDVRFSKALGVSTPTKKSTPEEWAGYYITQIQDNLIENNELNRQYGEYRKALNDGYDQFVKVNGREPTYEEFMSFADRSKYSKLNTIDQSLQYATKLQILPSGTYYSPDIITGLYQAKRNGKNINVDRDYFEDAVEYAMNPVQKAPSVKKYAWSNSDLGQTSIEDRDRYVSQLNANGSFEEAAAYKNAWWAAQPHADGISAEPSALDRTYGFYHDESWFNRVHDAIGDEYRARLDVNGEYIGEHGKNASYMDNVCYELHQIEKNREKTSRVESEFNNVKSKIRDFFSNNAQDYTADDFESFRDDLMSELDLEHNTVLKDYLENGYDPDKYCRELPISNEGIGAMIKAVWDGKDISKNRDWAAQIDNDYESGYGVDKPTEAPLFYAENQRKAANQRIADRNNAEKTVTDVVKTLAESGAMISKGAIPVTNATMEGHQSGFESFTGKLAKLWMDVFGSKHDEKLGTDHSPAEAAAADPVLAQLDTQDMPEVLTAADVLSIAGAKIMSSVNDDDICLADGIINYALPGAKFLYQTLLDNQNGLAKAFDALTYRNVYNDRVAAGYSEHEAAGVAAYAATDVSEAVNALGARYQDDDELSEAGLRLVNDIAQEEGSKDSYDLFKAISDDMHEHLSDASEKADAIMSKLLPAMILGTSESATPGFRAETNQITHDIANGTITPQDVADGLDEDNLWVVDFGKHQYDGQPVSEAAAQFLANGGSKSETFSINNVLYTREEYQAAMSESKGLLEKASGFLGSDRAFDSMSDELKQMIGYDAIADAAREAHPDDAQYYIDAAIHDAVEDIANPDQTWHTSPLMHNATDFIGQLNEIASGKDEQSINANLVNTRQSWVERNILKRDLTGFSSAVAAFLFGEEQSDTGNMADLFRSYGKFFSRNELDAAWNAFVSGKASYSEIEALVMERTKSISDETVSAINNPNLLEDSYRAIDGNVERLRQYSENPADTSRIVDRLMNGEGLMDVLSDYPDTFKGMEDTEWLNNQLDYIGILDDEEIRSRITEAIDSQVNREGAPKAYTPRQLEQIDSFVSAYKGMGAEGSVLAMLDSESLKSLGIDIGETGFASGQELMDTLDPDWRKPYGNNPGYTYGMVEAMGKGMAEGFRSIMKVPSLLNNFLHEVGYAIAGEEYNPDTAPDTFGLNRQYREFSRQDEQTSAMQQNVASRGEAFVEQGVSEVTRNAVTSAIGGLIGGAYAAAEGSRLTGLPLALENAAAAGDALQKTTTLLNHLPFASSVFLNEYDNQRKDGKTILNAVARAAIDASIEMFTESALFEKFSTLQFGGYSVGEHAANAAEKMGSGALGWLINAAGNVVSEIKEEEASEFLGRIVDTVEGVANGKSVSDAWNQAFEGYSEAAKNTAIATAFTTALFGAIDLGGITADYVQTCRMSNQEIDIDRLMACMRADFIASADEQGEAETKAETANENSETKPSDYNPATDVPYFGKKGEAASKALSDAVKAHIAEASEETTGKIGQAAEAMITALAEDRAEAAVQTQEAASEQTGENPQAQAEASQEAAPALSENAQRVRDYVDHSETAMDNAIIDKGAEMAAEQAVAEDAGLQAKQVSIERLQGNIQELQDKIGQLQQQSQTIQNQLQQAFRAVADEGFDMNSPQAVNVQFQKTQEKAAVDSEAAQVQEKVNSLTREAEEANRELEEQKQKIIAEVRESSVSNLANKLEEIKQKRAEMALDAEKSVNRQKAEAAGNVVRSDFTDEDYRRNVAERQKKNASMTGTLMRRAKNGQLPSSATTEAYTDPSNYPSRIVDSRRDDEWREDAANNRNEQQEREDYERRLLGDYVAGVASKRDSSAIPVSEEIYRRVAKGMDGRLGMVDSRQAYYRVDKGGAAVEVSFDADAMAAAEANALDKDERLDSFYAGDLMNENGDIVGEAYDMLYAAATDPETAIKTNPGDSFVHVTENNQYLIVKRAAERSNDQDFEAYIALTRAASEDGKTGLERGEERLQEAQKAYERNLTAQNDAAFELLKARNAFDAQETKEAANAFTSATKAFERAKTNAERSKAKYDEQLARQERNEEFVRSYSFKAPNTEAYYAFDKAKIQEAASSDSVAMKALYRASEQFADYRELSDEGFGTLLVDAGYSQAAIDRADPSELPFMYMDYLYAKASADASREAFLGTCTKLESDDELEAFVYKHGGYAADGIGGKGFASFSGRDYYNPNRVYYITEQAAHDYLDDQARKSIGINRTSAQYNAAVKGDIDAYARENNLSDEDTRYLQQMLSASRENGKQRANFYAVSDDGSHELGIRAADKMNPGANTWLRDEDGNYDLGVAKYRLKAKLDEMVETARREDAGETTYNGKPIKLNTKFNSIRVDYVDGYGNLRSRMVGEMYADEDGASRWFPSFSWMMNNATEITCNFYCAYGKKGSNADSQVNYKLYPTGSRADSGPNLAEQDDPNAYLRSANELRAEVDNLESFMKKFSGGDDEIINTYRRAWYNARYNLAKNEFFKALQAAEKATPDALRKAVEDVEVARVTMEFFSKNPKDTKASVPRRASASSNKTDGYSAKRALDEALDRYDKLTNDAVYADIPRFSAEATAIAGVIPQLQRRADAEAAFTSDEPVAPRNDPMARKIAEAAMNRQDASDTANLAVLKNLSDNGADVADLRTKAIEDYHSKIMEGMTDDEKLDYVANLARQAETALNSYTIDPNTDYDQKLGEMMQAQEKKANSKQGRRLRDIRRMAGSYKTLGGVNRAMSDLEQLEQSGYDVTEARDSLQRNMEAINNPYQAQKETIIEEATDAPEMRMNLHLFSQETAAETIDAIMDETGEVLSPLDTQAGEAADEMLERMSGPTPPGEIRTGYEDMVESIRTSNAKYYKSGDIRILHNAIAEFDAGVNNRTEAINTLSESLREKREQLRPIVDEMTRYDQMPGYMFADADRDRYNELGRQRRRLEDEIKSLSDEKETAKVERDTMKQQRQEAAIAMSANTAADNILRNQVAFTPDDMVGKNKQQTFKDGRKTARGMAKHVLEKLSDTAIYGNKTSYTVQQLIEAASDVMDEKEMAYSRSVANAVNSGIKEQKKAAALLDLAKARIDMKKGSLGVAEYNAKHAEAIDTIHKLSRMTNFTDEDYRKDRRAANAADQAVNAWEEKIDGEIISGSNLDAARTVFDTQLEVIKANVENAQTLLDNYYMISSDGIAGQLDGSSGGHLSNQMLRLVTGLVLNGNDTKKGKTFHPVSLLVDTFPRVVDKYLGKYSGVFNSIMTDPVMKANGQIARQINELKEQMKSVHLKTAEQREALAKILDDGMVDADIRENYPEFADELIKARDFHKSFYETINAEQNVVYSRNGLDPVKRRNNYYPHIQQEESGFLRMLGINTNADELPVGMLGNTSETTPAHQFNAHELERAKKGLEGMDLDAERVLLRYADIAYKTIYQTDNIIRLNDVITALGGDRSKDGDKRVGGLDFTDDMKLQKGKFNTFVRALETYRDMLAGKKTSKIDRAVEEKTGRKVFGALSSLTKLQGLAKVGGNLNPVVANFIPVYMASSLDPVSAIKATYQTVANRIAKRSGNSDGIIEKSNFYASRILNERDARTTFDKVANTLYIPMSLTDSISTELVYRTCYQNALNKLGGAGHEQQAAQIADNMCLRIMADKSTGMKGSGYNSTVGNVFLQFTHEGVNNISFLLNDLASYSGMKNGGWSAVSGAAKALASLLAMFAAGYGMNKFTGRNTAIDPLGAWQQAERSAKEGDSTLDTVKAAGVNLLDAINPVENITDGSLLEAPVPNAVLDVLKAIGGGIDSGIDAVFGNTDEDEDPWAWAYNLAKAAWGWVPGSTAGSRIIDTAKAAQQGYATNNSGKIKFPFDASLGNILKAGAFGLTSVDQAREYMDSGYRPITDSRSNGALEIQKATGVSFSKALELYDQQQAAKTKQKEADNLARWGESNTAQTEEAKQLRADTIPDNISQTAWDNINDDLIQKGIQMYRETGLATYPTEFKVYQDPERGMYFQDGGKNVAIDQGTLDKMNADLLRRSRQILRANDDPEAVEKQINKAKNEIKKKYLGGE